MNRAQRLDPADGYSWPYFDAWEQLFRGRYRHQICAMTSTDQADRDSASSEPLRRGSYGGRATRRSSFEPTGGRVAQAVGVGIEEQDE